jgi:hypothetical protein
MRARLLVPGILVAALASCADSTLTVAPLPATFDPTISTAFLPGDVLLVDVHLAGCFHDQRLTATLRVDGDSALVERFASKGNLAPEWRYVPEEALSPRQVLAMERLLHAYGTPIAQSCTNLEEGSVRHLRDGQQVRLYTFRDSSCRWFRERSLLDFGWHSLSRTVRVAKTAG